MYTQAQHHIIQFSTDRYFLLRTLRLFHSFYLLGAGDFYLEFISRVEHGFLFAPATVSNGWFQEEFNTCVGRTSLCGEAEYKLGLCGVAPLRIDGYGEGSWIVMDFGSVMVHIMSRDDRDFYKLEKLWGDAEVVDIDDILVK